jgi:DNA-binding transcriptional MerR regulator
VTSKSDTRIVLPPIPAKRYFTIGEVGELCGVKPHVLRYWEQEFAQLRPMKRRGNRRYYQHHEVLLIRRIRELLYEEGFTISGARNRLGDAHALARARGTGGAEEDTGAEEMGGESGVSPGPAGRGGLAAQAATDAVPGSATDTRDSKAAHGRDSGTGIDLSALRADLEQALGLLR